MSILREVRLFFANLFSGLNKADSIIIGQNSDDDGKLISVQQTKDTQRVAQHLLKGEITQEVKELRYRDYLVSEQSRNYMIHGDEAVKGHRSDQIPNYFGALNHQICSGINEKNEKEEYTLNFEYEDIPKFRLNKYCTQFYVDLKNNVINLYFNLLPNKDIATNKAFLNYIEKSILSPKLGGEFSSLNKIWFVSYKITALQNYLKFIFNELALMEIKRDDKNLILNYRFKTYEVQDLIGEFKVEELEKKYKTNAPKKLPTTDIEYNTFTKCKICGKIISETEAKLSKEVCGEECCSECIFEKMKNNLKDK